jgi:hypothetical protein
MNNLQNILNRIKNAEVFCPVRFPVRTVCVPLSPDTNGRIMHHQVARSWRRVLHQIQDEHLQAEHFILMPAAFIFIRFSCRSVLNS